MKEIKLGDYIDILTDYHSGGSYETLKENTKILYEPDYAVFVRTLNFERNDFTNDLIYCDKKSYDFLEYSHLKENDILMNKIANPGSIYIMPKVDYLATCAMNLFLIRCKNINQRYIYYVMKNSEPYIKQQAHGTTTKTITKDEVRNLTFKIHDTVEEQNKVADFLTSIDKKIDINNKINTELESMAKTLYDYWFLQFEFPNAEGKSYKSSGGKMVYNEQLKKEIPGGWEVIELGSLINENAKSTIQVNEVEDVGDIPFFTSGEDILHCSDKIVSGLNIYMSTGGNASIKIYYGDASYSTDTWCINMGENTLFYYEYLMNIKQQINDNYFGGSGLKHLKKDAFKKILLCIPNSKILKKFNNKVLRCYQLISNNTLENQQLASLRDFLLPLLMNGQVTFKAEKEELKNQVQQAAVLSYMERFTKWKQAQGYAARGDVDDEILKKIFDAMDEDDKK